MNIKKRHITSCFPPSQGGLGWVFSCLFLMFFVMPSCQEDEIPHDTTEVMMTFTTRALVTQGKESASVAEERMKDLRVIMVRENGMVVHNHKVENINASSVTVTFQTPVKTGGEDFRFFAIANEGSIVPTLDFAGIANTDTATLIHKVIGEGEFSIPQNLGVPQTKYWTKRLRQVEKDTVSKQLDFMVGKISLRFVNHTSEAQSLTGINITGITPATQGYLFKQNANDYVGTQYIASAVNGTKNVGTHRNASARNATENNARATSNIIFNDVENIAVGDSSAIQHYYTYPIQTISGATLHATWNEKEYTLPLDGITSLARGQHLQIVVTLTGEGMIYAIADWNQDNKTHIGSPTVGSDYDVKDWQGGTDIVIGGESGGEDPDPEPEPGGGYVLWSGSELLDWQNNEVNVYCEVFNDLIFSVTTDYKIRITYEEANNGAQLQFKYNDGNGMGIPELNNSNSTNITEGTTSFEFSIDSSMLDKFIGKEDSVVAFYMIGAQLTVTKVTLFLPATQ